MANRKLFVNLPVRDVKRSTAFFSKLGFEFSQHFTDEKAACMVINGETSAMLLAEPYFETFTTREVCDTSTHTEALFTLSCESRAEVDELVQIAVDNGGKPSGEARDHGFMYDWGFYDLDGHGWGVCCMDPSLVPK